MEQIESIRNPAMDQEFLTDLPSEIIINVLSRLPVRSIISCKCLCKQLLELVETGEFANCHLSWSVPGLAVSQLESESRLFKLLEFRDTLDVEHHDLHYNLIAKFNLPFWGRIISSANGLLLLCDYTQKPNCLYVCNPITRDYIQLHCPQKFVVTHGFGVSKMSGQHKVVRILHYNTTREATHKLLEVTNSEYQLYTLGTGSWRRLGLSVSFSYEGSSDGAFIYGNLHWLVRDSQGSPWISCFDLETEVFSTFSLPPRDGHRACTRLLVLGDCLCLCENTVDGYNGFIVIWSMKEYGVERSWTKDFVISKNQDFSYIYYAATFHGFSDDVYPIKVFQDGDILMEWEDIFFYYSSKAKASKKSNMFKHSLSGSVRTHQVILHTPSFLSLKSFEMENASSF